MLTLPLFEASAGEISLLVIGLVAMEGKSHWMEDVMLVGVYTMHSKVLFFLPARLGWLPLKCIHVDDFGCVPEVLLFSIG